MTVAGVMRLLVGAAGVLSMVLGLVLSAAGGSAFISGLWFVVVGGALLIAAVWERGRYRSDDAGHRSDAAASGSGEVAGPVDARFEATGELFTDPTSGVVLRVWMDPRTGERRYLSEE